MKIRLKNLKKTYPDGKQALKGVSLDLRPGLYGLLGPNGAGKTTLLSILTCLLEPSEGSIEAEGFDLPRELFRYRSRLGFLPQLFDVFPRRRGGKYWTISPGCSACPVPCERRESIFCCGRWGWRLTRTGKPKTTRWE